MPLHDRWTITGPDGEGYVWFDVEEPEGVRGQHINLGKFDEVGEKLVSWLAQNDYGDR